LKHLSAKNGVTLHTFIPSLSNLFGTVDGLVCMGGYNTLAEAISQGVPTVCVPRSVPRSEQLLRARAFEKLGLLRCIVPEQLSVEKLRLELSAAFECSRQTRLERARSVFGFDGARQAAGHLAGLLNRVARNENQWVEHVSS
jgi:predicted glycosyltransferase